jgi:hypothetical protein
MKHKARNAGLVVVAARLLCGMRESAGRWLFLLPLTLKMKSPQVIH